MLYSNIYDPLVHRDHSGGFVPKLAEKWEYADEVTLRFTLRKGVTFHNGEEFNSDSVKFTIERYSDPKSQAATKVATIAEVNVVDDHTVDFVTKAPDPILFGDLVDGFFMVPPKYYQDVGPQKMAVEPVGTGPFVFKEWVQGDRLVLTANKDYWAGAPKVNNLTFRFVPEDSTRLAGLQNGELDIVNDLPPALAKDLKGNDQITLSTATDPAIVHVGLKFSDEIMKNKKVRQALNYATNKDLIVERVLFGYAMVAGQVAFPDAFGYNPAVKPYPYDPDKAKQLLTEAGYPDGFEIDMGAPIGYVAQSKDIAQAVIGDWAKVGVKANLVMTEWAIYNKEKLLSEGRKGLEPAYLMLKRYPSLDAGATMRTAFPSDAQWNYNLYSNPQVDELIKVQDTTVDVETRKKALFEIAQILSDDAAYVWLLWADWIHGAQKGVNYKVRPDGLIMVYDDVTFSA